MTKRVHVINNQAWLVSEELMWLQMRSRFSAAVLIL